MNKFRSSFRPFVLAMLIFGSVSVFLTSCLKDHNNDNVVTPVAGLMAFNLSPDKTAAGFAISGNNLTNVPIAYGNFTGGYLNIYPGQRTIDAYDYNSQGGVLASVSGTFDVNKYYSVFLVGADSSYKNVLVNDNIDSLSGTTGQAYVRYINAIIDSVTPPAVTISVNGSPFSDAVAPFASVSAFKAVAPGDFSITVHNSGSINATRTISLEQRKVYTILLAGMPGSGANPVNIKYITNGTLDSTVKSTTGLVGQPVLN